MNNNRRIGLLAAVCLGTFLASLDISIVNVALPAIQKNLNSDLSGLQWIVNAYTICLSAFMLSASAFSDRYGHKRIWLSGVVIFTTGSILCTIASTMPLLLVGRMIQGFAGAILIPGAMSMISYAYPDPKERVAAVGIWSALGALALILGPLLGGILVHHFSWHSIFSINIPIGLLAFGLGAWGITERKHPENAAFDPLGQLLSITGLGLLSYALINAGETGGINHSTLPYLAGFIAIFIAFIWVEKKVNKPILQLNLFKNIHFSAINFASFILGFACYSSLFFFSVYLQQIQEYAPQEAGLRMMPQFLVTTIVSLNFSRLNRWAKTQTLMNIGYGIAGISFIGMSFFTVSTPYWFVGILFGLLGIGMGFAVPATSAVIMGVVEVKQFAMASATMNALRQMGMSIGVALLASIMSIRAISIMNQSLNASGVVDAQKITENAVRFHQFPVQDSLAIKSSYLMSMNSGFSIAMMIAGVSCLLAMFVMLKTKK